MVAKDSLSPSKQNRRKWTETAFTFEVDCTSEDAAFFARESCPKKLAEHIAYMASDAKRNAEVSLKWLSKADRRKFEEAQSKELDQWIENAGLLYCGMCRSTDGKNYEYALDFDLEGCASKFSRQGTVGD